MAVLLSLAAMPLFTTASLPKIRDGQLFFLPREKTERKLRNFLYQFSPMPVR
jgi:hypothetical protein